MKRFGKVDQSIPEELGHKISLICDNPVCCILLRVRSGIRSLFNILLLVFDFFLLYTFHSGRVTPLDSVFTHVQILEADVGDLDCMDRSH